MVREQLRGSTGSARYFLRQLHKMDYNKDGKIDREEFTMRLKALNTAENGVVWISDKEIGDLFDSFVCEDSDSIAILDLFLALRGNIESRRLMLINLAFNKLDRDKDGVVDMCEIREFYDTFTHPDVRRKRRTKDEIILEFFRNFDVGTNPEKKVSDGVVTWDEFHGHYWDLSVQILIEKVFVDQIKADWNISDEEEHLFLTLTEWKAPEEFPQAAPVYCDSLQLSLQTTHKRSGSVQGGGSTTSLHCVRSSRSHHASLFSPQRRTSTSSTSNLAGKYLRRVQI